MIDIRHLKAFIAVAEDLSFRKAAERLHTAQPALSRTIMDAEALLGVRLFERSTRVVQLTPAAKSLLPEAREILEHLDVAVRTARRIESGELGRLHVGYNDFALNGWLPQIVMGFRSKHPGIDVQLESSTSQEIAASLRRKCLDLGFLSGAHIPADLSTTVLRDERIVCLLPKGHRLATHTAIPLHELAGESFVLGPKPVWCIFRDFVDAFCNAADFKVRIAQEISDSNAIVGLVAAGVGISIYPDCQWLRLRQDVIIRPFQEKPPSFTTVGAWHPELQSNVVTNFIAVTELIVRTQRNLAVQSQHLDGDRLNLAG